ncbi:MAG: hypothetical protein ACT6S0_05785 [Roseateles sp.]|uniref:hypothetical protein n=1 Tax=Roseateles sp. TaxID=1971397 RepID=UPI004036F29E
MGGPHGGDAQADTAGIVMAAAAIETASRAAGIDAEAGSEEDEASGTASAAGGTG